MSGRGAGGGRGIDLAGADRVGLGADSRAGRRAIGFGGALDPLGGQADTGELGEQAAGLGERHCGRRPGHHRPQAGRHRGPRHGEFTIPGSHAVAAGAALIPGPAHRDGPQHGVDGLGPVGDELRLVPGAAVCPRAAVAGVGGQQLLQQTSTQPGHRGADGQFGRIQALPASPQRGRRSRGQALYRGGGLRRERRAEPPLSPDGSSGGSWPAATTGLASQIASDTSTICSLTARNSR